MKFHKWLSEDSNSDLNEAKRRAAGDICNSRLALALRFIRK